jgi:hypothetical protein
MKKQIRLNLIFHTSGRHDAGWKTFDDPTTLVDDIDHQIRYAKLAEEAKFDGIFLPDTPRSTWQEFPSQTEARSGSRRYPSGHCDAHKAPRPNLDCPIATGASLPGGTLHRNSPPRKQGSSRLEHRDEPRRLHA